jgi:hypothetical protein
MLRKHHVFLAFTALELIALAVVFALGRATLARRLQDEIPAKRQLVRVLELTDLALWTEARYTRNPSQADLFAPFQDLPSSFDHFPAGSVVAAPRSHQPAPAAGN